MKAKLLPPLDDEEIETQIEFVHHWHIDDWKGLPPKLYSPVFEGGDFSWKIYLFPEGNNTSSVSIYLACAPKGQDPADPDKDGPSWACCAQFGIVMWNPAEPSVLTSTVAQHRFEAEESDWGFSQFREVRRLFLKQGNAEHALIEDNQVTISVYVRIVKDPTGVLWHSFRNYNSKKETGYSGMKNQGATCYLNSLLQSLYFTNAFRHAVMGIPTEDEPDKVPAALQRVFCQLNTSDGVDTRKLTRSFGWDSGDAFTQHDVQELNRVLMDNLEGKMKGTTVDGLLSKIFVGQMKSYIKCVNVDFESSRIEDYWDVQLNVKGMKTLEDSFKDYVQVETLDGENQYMATGYGLQDAKKGVVFTSFPPVLHLQLKRYDFDFVREMMVKINDRYEFPTEIDLAPYLDESITPEESCEYALHGVLVHCGDLNIGHYYALIKPKKDGPWYKFDDERVTKATMKEVLEDNFGGDPSPADSLKTRTSRLAPGFKRHTSAYMLVYIRKSRLDEILVDDEIPQSIQDRVKREIEAEEAAQREREEQHLYMPVKVASVAQFQHMQHFDLAVWDPTKPGLEGQPVEAQAVLYKAKRSMRPAEFISQVATAINHPHPERLRFWTMISRDNKTYRLNSPIDNDSEIPLQQLYTKGRREAAELQLFLEEAPLDAEGNPILWGDKRTEKGRRTLLFIKYFDPATQTLQGLTTYVGRSLCPISDLIPTVCKALGCPLDTKLRFLEEVKPLMIDELDPQSTFDESELGDGDVICVEKVDQTVEDLPAGGFKTAQEYYDFLNDRVQLTFRRRVDPDSYEIAVAPDAAALQDIELWLSRSHTYDQMAQIVGQKLGVDATHLQFFTTSPNGALKGAVKRGNTTVSQMISTSYRNTYTQVIMYDVLRMSLAEFESKKLLKFVYLTEGISQEHRHEVLLPQTGTIADLVKYLETKSNLSELEKSRLVFWTARNHIFQEDLPRQTSVMTIEDNVQVYGALMADEEFDWITSGNSSPENGALIRVFQYHREPTHTHGVPFTFLLKPGEPFKETKARLQKKLGMFDKIFDRIKFSLIKAEGYTKPQYIESDEVVLFDHFNADSNGLLGLDHMTKARGRNTHGERAIFIKN